jgi:hypothetical protein
MVKNAEEPRGSILDVLHAAYLERKGAGKLPSPVELKKLAAALIRIEERRERLEGELEQTKEDESAAARALVAVIGKGRVVLPGSGEVRTPMCKGERVYLRKDSARGVRKL